MNSSRKIWLVAAIAFFAWSGFLLMIPPPYSSLIFLLMLAGGVIYYGLKQELPLCPALDWLARIRLSQKTAALLSLVAMILSAYLLDPTAPSRPAILALPLALIGGAALWVVLKDQSAPELTLVPTESGHIGWRPLAGGIMLLALLVEINGYTRITFLQHVSSHIQFALFCGGIVLVISGLAGRFPAITHIRLNTAPRLILLAITLLALIMRLWHIGAAVPIFVDETLFPGVIMRFWKEGDTDILMRSDGLLFHFSHLYAYGQWWTVGLFGRTLAGLRIFSAIIGTLTIPAMYLLARHLFNVRIGLIAAFLLATFPPHIQFSRLGLNNIADPLVGTLALGFLTRGFKSGQRLDYVIGGVMLGLTQYFYEGGRLLYPVLAVIWIAGIAVTRRVDWRGIGLFGLAAALISAPLIWAWASAGLTFLPRTDRSIDVRLPLIPRIGRALLTYIHLPEPLVCIHYYGGHTALILPGLVPVFLSGLFYALKGSITRKPGLWLLLLWLILVALGNSFISEPSMYTRYVTTFPALALVMAMGLDVVLPRVLLAIRAVSRMTLVVSVLIVLAGCGQVVYYFGWHLPRFTTQFWEEIIARDIDDAIFRGVDFPASTQALFVTTYPFDWVVTQEKLKFLGLEWTFSLILTSELTPDYLRGLRRDVDHAFFIESGDEHTLALLASQFDLEGPEYTGSIPESERYDLYYYHAPKDS